MEKDIQTEEQLTKIVKQPKIEAQTMPELPQQEEQPKQQGINVTLSVEEINLIIAALREHPYTSEAIKANVGSKMLDLAEGLTEGVQNANR